MNRRERRKFERESRQRAQAASKRPPSVEPKPADPGPVAGPSSPPLTRADVRDGVMQMVAKFCRDSTGNDTDWMSRGHRYRYRKPEAYMSDGAEYVAYQVLSDGTLRHSSYVAFDADGYVATGPALFMKASEAIKLIAEEYERARGRSSGFTPAPSSEVDQPTNGITMPISEMRAVVKACAYYVSNAFAFHSDMSDENLVLMVSVIDKFAPVCGLPDSRVPDEIIEKIRADLTKKLTDAA